jgi:hypothetical protein
MGEVDDHVIEEEVCLRTPALTASSSRFVAGSGPGLGSSEPMQAEKEEKGTR